MMSFEAHVPLASLVPEAFFQTRVEVLLWLIAVGAIAVLVFGAHYAVSAAVKLAKTLGMSPVLIGATVVSLGTTSPEAVVSVRAAIGGDPGLAMGNGIGSIICDTALIFGLCCLMTRLPLDRFVLSRHGWLQLGSGVLLTACALGFWAASGDINKVFLPQWVGIAFLGLLVGYLYLSMRWARQHPELVPKDARDASVSFNHRLRQGLVNLAVLAIGLGMVVGASDMLVGSIDEICQRHDVPEAVLAVTLVAFGTSLPELVTAIAAISKGHPELLVGNIIGADILNVLFVIGASATATPDGLHVEPMFFYLLLPAMMIVLLLLRGYIFLSGTTFKRWQGVPLLIVYIAFIVVLVTVFGVKAHG